MAKTLNLIVRLLSVAVVAAEEVQQVVAVDQVAVLEVVQQIRLVVQHNPGKEILVDLAQLRILVVEVAEAVQARSVLLELRVEEVLVADWSGLGILMQKVVLVARGWVAILQIMWLQILEMEALDPVVHLLM